MNPIRARAIQHERQKAGTSVETDPTTKQRKPYPYASLPSSLGNPEADWPRLKPNQLELLDCRAPTLPGETTHSIQFFPGVSTTTLLPMFDDGGDLMVTQQVLGTALRPTPDGDAEDLGLELRPTPGAREKNVGQEE